MAVPVILDTDIGSDIDDTWALAMMLRSPELDVKLVVSDTGDTTYRSKLIARMLEVAGRTDIPVGVGTPYDMRGSANQDGWVEGYDLTSYPGTVHEDGVGAIVDIIMSSPEPMTLMCIGPVPNIGEALDREPRIAENARFVGMHGSVRKGHRNSDEIIAECNVVNHTPACQKAFTAPWDITITPLDTCGIVVLEGERYQAIRQSNDPILQALMENYHVWLQHHKKPENFDIKSSILFDTVAIHLAFSEEFLMMEDLGIRVSDDGYTLIDDAAKVIRVATEWKDMEGFMDFLVARLKGEA